MKRLAYDSPNDAIAALAAPLAPVDVQHDCRDLLGRVLACSIVADRDHPAADVSAMDGYALAMRRPANSGEIHCNEEIPVTGESIPGSPPPDFSDFGVIRIFTGGMVPAGCDRVIQREYTIESPGNDSMPLGTVRWRAEAKLTQPAANIRGRGENIEAGEEALPSGVVVRSPQVAAIASFGVESASVRRRVRVAIITTGDELGRIDSATNETLPPWKIRNSNAHALRAIVTPRPYVNPPTMLHAPDEPEQLKQVVSDAVADHDIVLLTGGVSMGDHDYVPKVVSEIGAQTVFHKLPLRPGKPILGALYHVPDSATAKPIIGLPGNPVSATMGAVRFALPLIDKLAGITRWEPNPPSIMLDEIGTKTLHLHWMRAVRMTGPGTAELVVGKGSGDLVSLGASDGFIEMPPTAHHPGPWPFFAW
ncbi:molybdenum cofactor synthesis domain-containing protein [Rhodopirellula rubra]|uniref:Molybdopterin molybdenumtransferase n=1 Tax=Aporhodopirellula rubra TaxID=980271 RepID=A0A7W5E475_9BACT|nr:molybdopterin molybdotransferase MoeA [Aporhodopirellula rubra]MBB3209896.1 molybdenum cofactor synthesis domain-containing protein [Aporhodopirellula rubra]